MGVGLFFHLVLEAGSVCLASVAMLNISHEAACELLGESPLLLPHPNLTQEFWEWQVCATTAGFAHESQEMKLKSSGLYG